MENAIHVQQPHVGLASLASHRIVLAGVILHPACTGAPESWPQESGLFEGRENGIYGQHPKGVLSVHQKHINMTAAAWSGMVPIEETPKNLLMDSLPILRLGALAPRPDPSSSVRSLAMERAMDRSTVQFRTSLARHWLE